MAAMGMMITILMAVFAGIQGKPFGEFGAVKSIGEMYNETRKIVLICTKLLMSICDHHSPMACYDSVIQMQERLTNISLNSCDETIVRPRTRMEVHHSLDQLKIKTILNEIRKLDANSTITVELVIAPFGSLSSHVSKAIDTLEQISSKCSEIVSQPNYPNILTLNNMLIVLLVVVIFLVAIKDCYMLISAVRTFRRNQNRTNQSQSDPEELVSISEDVHLSEPIGTTEAAPSG